jgi:hypothetical protein
MNPYLQRVREESGSRPSLRVRPRSRFEPVAPEAEPRWERPDHRGPSAPWDPPPLAAPASPEPPRASEEGQAWRKRSVQHEWPATERPVPSGLAHQDHPAPELTGPPGERSANERPWEQEAGEAPTDRERAGVDRRPTATTGVPYGNHETKTDLVRERGRTGLETEPLAGPIARDVLAPRESQRARAERQNTPASPDPNAALEHLHPGGLPGNYRTSPRTDAPFTIDQTSPGRSVDDDRRQQGGPRSEGRRSPNAADTSHERQNGDTVAISGRRPGRDARSLMPANRGDADLSAGRPNEGRTDETYRPSDPRRRSEPYRSRLSDSTQAVVPRWAEGRRGALGQPGPLAGVGFPDGEGPARVVTVTIGRLEVRVGPPTPATPATESGATRSRRPQPSGLDDYLRARASGRVG